MKYTQYSAVIVGSGIAGLYAALRISELQKDVKNILVITKSEFIDSNSRYAQGGIVGVLPENKADSVNLHVKDTLKAGAGLSDPKVATIISEESAEIIDDLIKKGVKFDKDKSSNLSMTLEGAHSVRRILHSGGDSTGRHIGQALLNRVIENPKIKLWSNTQAVDLLIDENNECKGIITFNEGEFDYTAVLSNTVVLATGGTGQIYSDTTNPKVATGDGVALAYNAGAVIQDMEFIQFHPTALKTDSEVRFLISESVRGEGAKLKNAKHEEFMKKYNQKGDLAARDIVTRSIYHETKELNDDRVYLDATHLDKEFLEKRFPSISANCKEHGIDISKDLIPVSPAAHYTMGGIKVNMQGKTNIKGLFASGEASCTSLHGANRLASNSLLECVVESNELAKALEVKEIEPEIFNNPKIKAIIEKYEQNVLKYEGDIELLIKKLKKTMWQNAGIIRDKESLTKCILDLEELKKEFNKTDKCATIREYEFKNMLITAIIIAKSALNREESRGSHYRSDFPQTNEIREHSYIQRS